MAAVQVLHLREQVPKAGEVLPAAAPAWPPCCVWSREGRLGEHLANALFPERSDDLRVNSDPPHHESVDKRLAFKELRDVGPHPVEPGLSSAVRLGGSVSEPQRPVLGVVE